MARAIRRGTSSTTQVDLEVESKRSLQADGNADGREQDGKERAPGGQRPADLMDDRFDGHSVDDVRADGWTDAFDGIVSDDERRSMIAKAAYFIAQRRGFDGGLELEDWLAAEAEVNARLASS